jgi:hypothetical protein
MHHLFISYSRKDRVFVEGLAKAWTDQGRSAWVDWKDIPPTAAFMEEIRRAIEEADSFVFVISPDSVESPTCRQEVEHAAKNHKWLIPIVYRAAQADRGTACGGAVQLDRIRWRGRFRHVFPSPDIGDRDRPGVGAGAHGAAGPGGLLAIGGGTGVQLWDVESRQPIGGPLANPPLGIPSDRDRPQAIGSLVASPATGFGTPALTAPAGAVAFTGDGGALLTAYPSSQSIVHWDLDPRSWMRRICQIANRNLTELEWAQYQGHDVPYHETCRLGERER